MNFSERVFIRWRCEWFNVKITVEKRKRCKIAGFKLNSDGFPCEMIVGFQFLCKI